MLQRPSATRTVTVAGSAAALAAAAGAAVLAGAVSACTSAGATAGTPGGGVVIGGTVADRGMAGRAAAARLERAIVAAGGVAALGRARAFAWDGEATVTAGGRVVRIAGRWLVQPPDTAVVETYDVTRGPATARALVVAAPRGWVVAGDSARPMPPALLASERDEFALYEAVRLLPLRAGARLTSVDPDTAGHPGLRATRPGRPAVELWFAPDGRLAHVAAEVAAADGGAPVRQDLWLEGTVEDGGVRWPRRLRILQGGAPFFDLTVTNFRALARAEDARLAGPAAGR